MNMTKSLPHRVTVFRCELCNIDIPRLQVHEQLCHDEHFEHFFIWVCPECSGEVEEIEIDERDLS